MSKCLDDDVTYRGSITLPSGLNCPVHSFAIFSLRSRAVQNFTRFSRNCFNSDKKYFALSRPSFPSSQLEKSPSQLKTGTEVGYRTMEVISRCQKTYFSLSKTSYFSLSKTSHFSFSKNPYFSYSKASYLRTNLRF